MPNITTFNISENLISDLTPLLPALSKCSCMRKLVVHDNLVTNSERYKEDLFQLNETVDLVLHSSGEEAFLSKRSATKNDLFKTLMLCPESAENYQLNNDDAMKLADRYEIMTEEMEVIKGSTEWVTSKPTCRIFYPDAIDFYCDYLRKLYTICHILRLVLNTTLTLFRQTFYFIQKVFGG